MYGFPNARAFLHAQILEKILPRIIAFYITKSIKSRLSQPQLASECKNLQQIKNWTLLCSSSSSFAVPESITAFLSLDSSK
jgi:hypothetical protein